MNILNDTQYSIILAVRNGKPVIIAPKNNLIAERAFDSIDIEQESLGAIFLIPAGCQYGAGADMVSASSIDYGNEFNSFIDKIRTRNHVRHAIVDAVTNVITRPLLVRLQEYKASNTTPCWDFDCEPDLSIDHTAADLDVELRAVINSKNLFSYRI